MTWWTSILPCMCHFGLEGVSKAGNHLLRFYGLGAGETPAEQSSGGRLGIWTVDTEIAVTPYVNPQACRYAVAGVWRCPGRGEKSFCLFCAAVYLS